jgi:ribosomal protein S18 acetylase RimI-like enzyme
MGALQEREVFHIRNLKMIRVAREQDRKAIEDILAETMGLEYREEDLREVSRVISGEQLGFVAAPEDYVAGYITCLKTFQTYKLETLAVRIDFQGMGIGRKLVRHLEGYLVANFGKPTVLNVVTNDNSHDPVKDFYLRCGYRVAGVVENEYVLGDRQIHLSKLLD